MEKENNLVERDLAVLARLFTARLESLSANDDSKRPPPLRYAVPGQTSDPYETFQRAKSLSFEERTILLLALIPHLQPAFFDVLSDRISSRGGVSSLIGGVRDSRHRGMLPSGETVIFLLAEGTPGQKSELLHYFEPDHLFSRENILQLESIPGQQSKMSGRILLSTEYLSYFMGGAKPRPALRSNFPASFLTTDMEWEDLVVAPHTAEQILKLQKWLTVNGQLPGYGHLSKSAKPGYRVLFYGPQGTGKALTAALLGKKFAKDVYRIDLSGVISKYLGETEKNLDKVFTQARHQGWILLFDEADALFGKRTDVQSAHDRYANVQTDYLLRRLEDHPGLSILSFNSINNIDNAFRSHFNAVVHFTPPDAVERCRL